MGNNKQQPSSRRQFFAALSGKKEQAKVKLLTPDGKLVEVDKDVYDKITGKQKASNADIYNWMDNPSKEQ